MVEASQKESRLAIDVGAGFGELFINRAKLEPEKRFIIIEPLGWPDPSDREIPKNLTWIKGRLTEKESLPLQDASVDEVNFNFSISTMCVDHQGFDQEPKEYLQVLLKEPLRILKNGGQLIIREEAGFCQEIIKPSLTEMGMVFEETAVEEEDLSLTGQESLTDYYFNPEKNHRSQPRKIVIIKTMAK